jgi:hypothetical protein
MRYGVVLSPATDIRGYLKVSLSRENKSRSFSVHRLVALAFISNTYSKPEVNHIDGTKNNNKVDNLEFATTKENVNHAFANNLHKGGLYGKFGSDNPKSIPIIKLNLDHSFICEYGGIKEAARENNADHSSIIRVCKNKQHTAGGFKWMYKTEYYGNK